MTATAAGGTHPTGMHSCFIEISTQWPFDSTPFNFAYIKDERSKNVNNVFFGMMLGEKLLRPLLLVYGTRSHHSVNVPFLTTDSQ